MEELVKKVEEKGINVEDVLLTALSKVDPEESIRLRIQLAEKYMKELEDYINKGDAVQASEKAYKVAEEIVKALAEKFKTPEYQQAMKEGRWYTYTLGKTVNNLAKKVGEWILDGWNSAYFLHVWGFHEAKLSIDDITLYVNKVIKMYEEARKII
ncbi:PaREP1 family protein [Sulfurisphaera ohwakuensis]|uniref:PaREP1 family protein n=1 Tax=Sulfurisphaera ohwakuensis TaxID=69656 RepID=UPI0036F31F34